MNLGCRPPALLLGKNSYCRRLSFKGGHTHDHSCLARVDLFSQYLFFPGQYYNPPRIYHLILAELVCSSHTLQGLDCSDVRHSLERAFFSHPTETATVCSKKRKSPIAEREQVRGRLTRGRRSRKGVRRSYFLEWDCIQVQSPHLMCLYSQVIFYMYSYKGRRHKCAFALP